MQADCFSNKIRYTDPWSNCLDAPRIGMAYFICSGDVEKLNGRAPFSDGECVALVQATPSVGHTSRWRPGPRVVDLSYLNPGTVIANFVFDEQGNGRFPNQHGYHAALFVDFCGRSVSSTKPKNIRVMDQWRTRIPDTIRQREIVARGKSKAEGSAYSDSDNADQFYVVVSK